VTGTVLNIAAVLAGGSLGLLFGARLPERIKSTIVAGMGLFTAAVGLKMFLGTTNPLFVLGGLLVGGLLGEWWRIEDGLQSLGGWLHRLFERGGSDAGNFVRGFMTASLLFCVGPLTILGSVQDGLSGNYELLAVKSALDGFAALAFASSLGIGVLFSVFVILVYQGGISLLAAQFDAILNDAMLAEMTAVGGVILAGIAVSNLLEIRKIRVGNFLPALAVSPLIVYLAGLVD